tara:strand:- start:7470 stop:8282 length:813 start_codon:yes stop_codon:yes gene_type:complete
MAKFLDKWKNKVTTYKTKAEEIRAMIEDGAETIRDIRADVEGTVEDLKADSEEKMMESLEKIQDSERVFKDAGYLLQAVELEMGFNPKVVAILKREKDVGVSKKERLLKKHEDDKVVKTVLTSLFKAEALEDKVHLRRLTFSEVHLEMGLVPAVHVLWEDKSSNGISAPSTTSRSTSSFGSSSSSFTGGGSSFISSSPFNSSTEEEPAEEVESAQDELEETRQRGASKEKEQGGDEPTQLPPVIEPTVQDPEDEKWTSFPDVSFPSGKGK